MGSGLLGCWLFVVGCAESHPGEERVDLFDPDQVLQVRIEMEPGDWNALRRQSRDLFETLSGEDCLATPFERPFTYFEATVTVDGVRRERVGVRKKGFFGSLSEEKPSLKIKFDEFVEGQDLFGTERITLNNAQQDPAYVNQCLGYGLFERAGVPAPRCNFAHVTVNGMDLGIYVHVENVKKRFLRRHFGDDEGGLFEGTLSDFRPGWDGTFEQKTNRERMADRGGILAVERALEGDDEGLLDRLDAVVDLEGFLDLWASEVLMLHWDGYAGNTNNFYVYDHPADRRLRFVPWGIDATFGQDGPRREEPVVPAFTMGVLAHRLWSLSEGRRRYEERLRELLDGVWDERWLLGEIDRMEALLRPYLQARDVERGFDEALDARRRFVRERRERLLGALEASFEPAPLRERLCLVPIGGLEGTFDTRYGVSADRPLDFEGSLDITLRGDRPAFRGEGSLAGPDDGRPDGAVVGIVGLRADGVAIIVGVLVDRERLRPGVSIPVGLGRGAPGFVLELDTRRPGAEPSVVGFVGRGRITFSEAGSGEGDRVVGRLEGRVFEPF